MNNSLATLVRVQRQNVDRQRRELADREAMLALLAQKLIEWKERILLEQKTARESIEAAQGYGEFAKIAIVRRQQLENALAEAEAEVERSREALLHEIEEMKRYELALANREAEEAAVEQRRETAAFDETASTAFIRKGN